MCLLLAQLIIGFFSFFLLWPFTVLMKKTRAVKQSIFLDVYVFNTLTNEMRLLNKSCSLAVA
jgi:hypothetical protein